MSKFNEKKVMPRYSLICMLLTLEIGRAHV